MYRVILILLFPVSFNLYSQDNIKIAEDFFTEFFINNNLSQKNYDSFFSEDFKSKCPYTTLISSFNSINNTMGKSEKIVQICQENDTSKINIVNQLEKNGGLIKWKVILDSIQKVSGFFIVKELNCISNDNKIDTTSFGYHYDKLYQGNGFNVKYKLSIPKNCNKFSLILLLQGSGVHQSDYKIGKNNIFKQMSEYLLSNQIASISIDKRSVSNPELVETLDDEQISDAIEILLEEIKKNEHKIGNVYILGHSLGAISALSIAKNIEEIDGLILVGGTLRNIFSVMEDQVKLIEKKNPESLKIMDLKEKISYGIDSLEINSPAYKLPYNIPAIYWTSIINHCNVDFNLLKDKKIAILYGAKDIQLNSKDINLWKEISIEGIKIKKLPFTNHFMGFNLFKPKLENSIKHTKVRKNVLEEIVKIIEDR